MNKVFQIYGLHLLKFKNAGIRERYERGDKTARPEKIHLSDAWFFCPAHEQVKDRFSDGVKLFTEGQIIDPDINKNRAMYVLESYDRSNPIGGL